MKSLSLHSFKRAFWTIGQPLTARPCSISDPISDLFVWRSNSDWQTYFELFSLPALFQDQDNPTRADFVFFNSDGLPVLYKRMTLQPCKRHTINVSSIVGATHGDLGTFAVFHEPAVPDLLRVNAHLAERGYVSYCYRNAPLKAYVHGNLDAISRSNDGVFHLLGGIGILKREYRLQHKIEPVSSYEFAFVNPSSRRQRVLCKIISTVSNVEIVSQQLELDAGGSRLFSLLPFSSSEARLIIESRMIMARPLVFRVHNGALDVFHG